MANEDIKDPDLTVDPNWEPPKEGGEKKAETPDPVIELKAQLERERAARVEAEKRANEAAQGVHKSQLEVADSQLQLVNSAIERVKESSDQLESAFEAAMSAQDFRAAAKIQRDLSANEARLLQLENGKAAMEAQPKPAAPLPIKTMPQDPVEALASQLTPRSAAWVRAHPEYARDKRLEAAMVGAHNIVVGKGVMPDTDEYFKRVESILEIGAPQQNADDGGDAEDPMAAAAKAAPARQAAPPAAPVSRGNNGRSVRLSAAEREAAEMSGMSEQEYAAAKQEMVKQGRIH